MEKNRKSPRPAALLAICLLGVLATGCAADPGGAPAPISSEPPRNGSTWATGKSWAADLDRTGARLYVTTLGSSSCPAVAAAVDAPEPGRLEVALSKPDVSGPCTADLAPHTSSVPVPV